MTRQGLLAVLCVLALTPAALYAEESSPTLPASKWRQWQTGALRADRLQHASLSAAAALGIGIATDDAAIGFAGSLVLGITKELVDTRSTHFDWGDLAADALGAGLGAWAAAAATR